MRADHYAALTPAAKARWDYREGDGGMKQGRDSLGRLTSCDHYFVWLKDWGGDGSIPNGTFDCSRYECRLCGEDANDEQSRDARERDEGAKEDAAEAKADYLRDVCG